MHTKHIFKKLQTLKTGRTLQVMEYNFLFPRQNTYWRQPLPNHLQWWRTSIPWKAHSICGLLLVLKSCISHYLLLFLSIAPRTLSEVTRSEFVSLLWHSPRRATPALLSPPSCFSLLHINHFQFLLYPFPRLWFLVPSTILKCPLFLFLLYPSPLFHKLVAELTYHSGNLALCWELSTLSGVWGRGTGDLMDSRGKADPVKTLEGSPPFLTLNLNCHLRHKLE